MVITASLRSRLGKVLILLSRTRKYAVLRHFCHGLLAYQRHRILRTPCNIGVKMALGCGSQMYSVPIRTRAGNHMNTEFMVRHI